MKKVLIIDDERLIRENIGEILRIHNYEVQLAENGKKGITEALFFKPDLIICDIMMPEMDGYEVLSFIRQNETIGNTPFIFLSAKAQKEDTRTSMNLGADDYLTKPFDIQELVATIETRLQRSQKANDLINLKLNQLTRQYSETSSHEFNTPLNSIMGFCAAIINYESSLSKEKIIEMVRLIEKSSYRLKRTVDNIILYHNQINANTDINYRNEFTYGNTIICNDFIETLSSLSRKYNRNDDLIANFESAVVQFPSKYIIKVIEELTDNALKFSKAGSQIIITGKITDNDYILTVEDKGIGFSTENISNIGAYIQFDKEKLAQQGSGLGLAIVKNFAQLLHTNFNITSEPENGTTVTFTFRCVPKEALKKI